MKLTPRIISAAGKDAGNRSARAHGRRVWTVEDYGAACRESDRLYRIYDASSGKAGAPVHKAGA